MSATESALVAGWFTLKFHYEARRIGTLYGWGNREARRECRAAVKDVLGRFDAKMARGLMETARLYAPPPIPHCSWGHSAIECIVREQEGRHA